MKGAQEPSAAHKVAIDKSKKLRRINPLIAIAQYAFSLMWG
jgi:hypothetical protein